MGIRPESLLSFVVFLFLAASVSAQTITEFPLPTTGSSPWRITAGPDGNLWFTEFIYNSSIGRITTAGSVTEFAIPTPFVSPTGIATGPDGNLWFTGFNFDEGLAALIGRISPAGAITEFPLPNSGSGPHDITAGPDGNLWFTEAGFNWNKIGRITPTGLLTEFPVPTAAGPASIAAGPDGNLWFTVYANKIGRITTAGVITEFSISTAGSDPYGITAGPDGNLWFTERLANKIGRITTAGVITEFPIPTAASLPVGITTGPDGNVWFTEVHGIKIGRITIAGAPALETRILPVVGSTPGANGTFFRTSVQLNNPGTTAMTGRIVFHRSGSSASGSDPALPYSLSPGQTLSIADLLPAMGRSGLGSADIEITSGAVPVATARVFNDAGPSGTTGFTEEAMRAEEALRAGQTGVLLIPPEFRVARFNVGVRTLEEGASVNFTLRNAAGAVLGSSTRVFPPDYHEQQGTVGFLRVFEAPPGGSIAIAVASGSAIFYGATVDNTTGDPSLQIARADGMR
jgi:streptogramin lyase